MAAGVTVYGFVVNAGFAFQTYVAPPFAVNIAVAFGQIVGEFTVIVGEVFTVIVPVPVALQPFGSVYVHVYVVVDAGLKAVVVAAPPPLGDQE